MCIFYNLIWLMSIFFCVSEIYFFRNKIIFQEIVFVLKLFWYEIVQYVQFRLLVFYSKDFKYAMDAEKSSSVWGSHLASRVIVPV